MDVAFGLQTGGDGHEAQAGKLQTPANSPKNLIPIQELPGLAPSETAAPVKLNRVGITVATDEYGVLPESADRDPAGMHYAFAFAHSLTTPAWIYRSSGR